MISSRLEKEMTGRASGPEKKAWRGSDFFLELFWELK